MKYKIFLACFLFTLFVSAEISYAVEDEMINTIREDCTGYSNCFTSLHDWQRNFGNIDFKTCPQGDISCLRKILIVKIEGKWSVPQTREFVLDGWTTHYANPIKIIASGESRHKGVWSDTAFRIVVSSGSGIVIKENNVALDGLQIYHNVSEPYSGGIRVDILGSSNIRISNTLVKGTGGAMGESSGGIIAAPNTGINSSYYLWNNIIYDYASGTDVSAIKAYFGKWFVYNTTLYNNATGISSKVSGNTDIVVKNILAQKNSDGFLGSFSALSSHNISDLQSDAPGTNSQNSTSVLFRDAEKKDFHLAFQDTFAKSKGAMLSADENFSIADDIDGETRTSPWDIGADEDFSTQALETVPPVLSRGTPKGELQPGTRTTNLFLESDKNSICRHAPTSGIPYSGMNNSFEVTGGKNHSTPITGLEDGKSYSYYVRCSDEKGNVNSDDYVISFFVVSDSLSPQPSPSPAQEEEKSDSDNDGLSDSDEYLSGTQKDKADTDGDGVSDGDEIARKTDPLNSATSKKPSSKFLSSARGRILLQVQRRGEAWYMNPVDSRRYFLRDGASAYEIMRKLGLGLTNANLAKIPEAGSLQKGDAALVSRLKGRILLQVESRGEAWYIHPVEGKRYYLKDGSTAYELMRKLGMGVYTSDLITLSYGRL